MDSHEAKRVLRGEWGDEGDRVAARDMLLCDIHEWMEECMRRWKGWDEAERGEGITYTAVMETLEAEGR